jgi:hypothetical protein
MSKTKKKMLCLQVKINNSTVVFENPIIFITARNKKKDKKKES